MNIEEARQFRDAAVADGWSIWPTYKNFQGEAMEPQEQAASLERNGFKISVITRPGPTKNEVCVSIWGPDKLSIALATEGYDFAEIERGLRRCGNCGAEDVDTQRYSFAGRCCAECRPAMAQEHERPGWTN